LRTGSLVHDVGYRSVRDLLAALLKPRGVDLPD
jgi:hypothetical protein